MSDWPIVSFAPGGRAACVKGQVWLLLDAPLTHPVVLEAWSSIDGGASVDEIVGTILSRGMAEAPDFGLAAADGSGEIRFVLRGAVGASVVGTGDADELVAHGILSDQTVSGVVGFVLHGANGRGIANLPVIAGILPVSHLSVALPTAVDQPTASSHFAPDEATSEVPDARAQEPPDCATDPATTAEVAVVTEEPPTQPQPAAESATSEDPKVLASIREYERLFGSPEGSSSAPADAPDAPAEPDAPVETPAVMAPEPEPPEVAPAELDVVASPEFERFPSTPTTAPSPSTGGFIDALPDFLGLGGSQSPSPSSPPPTPTLGPIAAGIPEAGNRTVNRAHLQAATSVAGPTVWAAWCPVGHASQAFAAQCRVCGATIPAQEPQEIPRPVLGRLAIPSAAPILLDGDLVLGRDPRVPPGGTTAPRLVVINDPRMEVSSQHASITLNFWDVCLTDLGSTNGTEIVDREGRRQRLAQNSPVTIQPGTKIILAEVVELTFEATA